MHESIVFVRMKVLKERQIASDLQKYPCRRASDVHVVRPDGRERESFQQGGKEKKRETGGKSNPFILEVTANIAFRKPIPPPLAVAPGHSKPESGRPAP